MAEEKLFFVHIFANDYLFPFVIIPLLQLLNFSVLRLHNQ